MQAAVVTVDVVHIELQLLHHLKVIVDNEGLGEAGVEAVLYYLCAPKLMHTNATESDAIEIMRVSALAFDN